MQNFKVQSLKFAKFANFKAFVPVCISQSWNEDKIWRKKNSKVSPHRSWNFENKIQEEEENSYESTEPSRSFRYLFRSVFGKILRPLKNPFVARDRCFHLSIEVAPVNQPTTWKKISVWMLVNVRPCAYVGVRACACVSTYIWNLFLDSRRAPGMKNPVASSVKHVAIDTPSFWMPRNPPTNRFPPRARSSRRVFLPSQFQLLAVPKSSRGPSCVAGFLVCTRFFSRNSCVNSWLKMASSSGNQWPDVQSFCLKLVVPSMSG